MALQMTNVTAVVPKRPKRSSFLGAAAALGGAYSALPADVKRRILLIIGAFLEVTGVE